jgi:predicted site-specific integrase-resolvase
MTVVHIRPDQLAQRWAISKKTLERWRCEGAGPRYLKLSGCRVVYRLDDIESYESARYKTTTAKSAPGG